MYSYQQKMATFMQVDTEAANAWCPRNNKLFLDFKYINLVKL